MKNDRQVPSTEAEQAMHQILQAEREAEQAIEDCRVAAQKAIRDVQAKAQRIHTRANQRITNMEMRHGHKLNQLIKDIEKEADVALNHGAGDYCDDNKLRAIANELAAALCGGRFVPGSEAETGK